MVEIIKVENQRQRREFVNFPLRLYKGNPYYAPGLYGDEMKVFTDKNVYHDTCDDVFFLSRKDGKTVGRIQGIIQKQFNELHKESRVRFTRFHCIDDQEVATALFKAVEDWAKAQGMNKFCGPLGYSDLEREGLLISGFEELSTFEEEYNYPYYQKLVEGAGFEKEVDWVEFQLRAPKTPNPMIPKVAKRALELNHLHVVDPSTMSKKEYISRYKDGVFDCIDECYAKLYGTVPFTEKMKKQLIDQFLMIVNKNYLVIVCDDNDKVQSFGLCFPSISKALQKSGGRLTPPALLRLMKAIKDPRIIDLGLVAVMPELQARGVNAVMIETMIKMLNSSNVEYCETNLNLEDNLAVQSMWKYLDAKNHKRRRSFMKTI